jgi:hypothetical protein
LLLVHRLRFVHRFQKLAPLSGVVTVTFKLPDKAYLVRVLLGNEALLNLIAVRAPHPYFSQCHAGPSNQICCGSVVCAGRVLP